MIWKEIKAETLYLSRGLLKYLKIDFGAVKTWVQMLLAAVMMVIYLYSQHQTEKRVQKAETEAITAVKEVVQIKDSLRIITRYQDARTAEIKQEIRELKQAGQIKEKLIKQLMTDIEELKISKAHALRKIDKLQNGELVQFFSTIKTDEN